MKSWELVQRIEAFCERQHSIFNPSIQIIRKDIYLSKIIFDFWLMVPVKSSEKSLGNGISKAVWNFCRELGASDAPDIRLSNISAIQKTVVAVQFNIELE